MLEQTTYATPPCRTHARAHAEGLPRHAALCHGAERERQCQRHRGCQATEPSLALFRNGHGGTDGAGDLVPCARESDESFCADGCQDDVIGSHDRMQACMLTSKVQVACLKPGESV
eukprot:6179540-Pleurochrysis_carterae.AAC.4